MLVGKMGKLSLYARQQIVNLHQLKKNHFQIANEIREGDNINVSIPVLSFPIRCFHQTGNLHDKLNHARNEIKKMSSDIFISSMNRCEETISFFRLNLPLFCWHIETSKCQAYCTKEIGLDLEWGKLLQILLIVVYFVLWVLPVLHTLDKGYTLDYSSNKNFSNLF